MRYVSLFLEHHPGPWTCFFCEEPVKKLLVHHKDHDRDNNAIGNLVAAHKKCHDQYHLTGREVTWGEKISAVKKRQWAEGVYANKRPAVLHHTEETKQKIRDAKTGVPASEASKEALRQAWAGGRYKNRSKANEDERRMNISKAMTGKQWSAARRAAQKSGGG